MQNKAVTHLVFENLSVPMKGAPRRKMLVQIENKDHSHEHEGHDEIAKSVIDVYQTILRSVGPVLLSPGDLNVLSEGQWLDQQYGHLDDKSLCCVKLTHSLLHQTFILDV